MEVETPPLPMLGVKMEDESLAEATEKILSAGEKVGESGAGAARVITPLSERKPTSNTLTPLSERKPTSNTSETAPKALAVTKKVSLPKEPSAGSDSPL